MGISRRWFLKAVPAAPMAAKAAAAKLVAEPGVLGFPGLTPSTGGYAMPTGSSAQQTDNRPAARLSRWRDMLRHFGGLPQWKLEEIRENCKYVAVLDPDIAARHSWSVSVKMQEQRRRNFEARVRQITERDFGVRESEIEDRWKIWL